MKTSLAFRAPVSVPIPTPGRDEGFSPKAVGLRMVTMHFNSYQPSAGRGVVWYVRPMTRHDELTAFTCQRSGYRFPGSYREVDEEGKIVGRPFLREAH